MSQTNYSFCGFYNEPLSDVEEMDRDFGLAAAGLVVAVSVITAVVASAVGAETASSISYLRLKPQK
jgi:hypothetical protein